MLGVGQRRDQVLLGSLVDEADHRAVDDHALPAVRRATGTGEQVWTSGWGQPGWQGALRAKAPSAAAKAVRLVGAARQAATHIVWAC